MRRILYLLQEPQAPSETFIRREIDALRREGWRISILSMEGRALENDARFRSGPGEASEPRKNLVRLVFRQARGRPWTTLALLRRIRPLRRLVEAAFHVDRIHVHFADLAADMGAVAAAAAGRPLSLSVHARDIFAQPRSALAARAARPRTIFVCTKAGATRLEEAGVPRSKIVHAPHGIPLDDYPFDPSPKGSSVCGVGRFVAKKGFDLLIESVNSLRRSGQDISLRLIGDGPGKPGLEAAAATLDDPGAVEFTGFLSPEETARQIRRCAVLALPSRRTPDGDRDGIANVLLEAMALGTPVVTTTAGAAAEAIENNRDGILVAPESPGEIAAAIRRLRENPSKTAAMTRSARRKVEDAFDLKKNIRLMSAQFERKFTLPEEAPG